MPKHTGQSTQNSGCKPKRFTLGLKLQSLWSSWGARMSFWKKSKTSSKPSEESVPRGLWIDCLSTYKWVTKDALGRAKLQVTMDYIGPEDEIDVLVDSLQAIGTGTPEGEEPWQTAYPSATFFPVPWPQGHGAGYGLNAPTKLSGLSAYEAYMKQYYQSGFPKTAQYVPGGAPGYKSGMPPKQ